MRDTWIGDNLLLSNRTLLNAWAHELISFHQRETMVEFTELVNYDRDFNQTMVSNGTVRNH